MKAFLRKHWSNILFFGFLALLIIPQTRMPIQVFVQRLIAFSPSEADKEDRKTLKDYNWELQNLKGEKVNFATSEGKVIVVNFWATWCPPCVAEMPSFQKLYNKYQEKVDFYFVTSERGKNVQRLIKKHDYNLPIYLQKYEAPVLLKSNVLPTTYLISKKGEIIINEEGVANWNSKKMHLLLDTLLSK